MTDDGSGIERLRSVVREVAASLPPPRRRIPSPARPLAWALAGAVVVAVLLLGRPVIRESPVHPPVEVLSIRIHGHTATARVVDSAEAGSIVVVPVADRMSPATRAGGVR